MSQPLEDIRVTAMAAIPDKILTDAAFESWVWLGDGQEPIGFNPNQFRQLLARWCQQNPVR